MSNNQPDEVTAGTILAFMYFTFAHLTDGELSDDELEVIQEKITEWGGDVGANLKSAIDWYNSCTAEERLNVLGVSTVSLKDVFEFEDANLRAVLDDLVAIAKADGKYDSVEKEWVRITAEALGLEYQA